MDLGEGMGGEGGVREGAGEAQAAEGRVEGGGEADEGGEAAGGGGGRGAGGVEERDRERRQ